jgi:hypothetical protein
MFRELMNTQNDYSLALARIAALSCVVVARSS